MKPLKCYLHIGTEKTATTSIQEFLNANRESLLRAGIIYTKSAGARNNIFLPVAAYDLDRRDNLLRKQGLESEKQISKFQKKIIKDLKFEILSARKKNPGASILFSSEHIQSRLRRPVEVQRLKAILEDFGVTEFVVIVYLRNPGDIVSSLYSTAIKAGSVKESPPTPDKKYFANICSHRKTIERFAKVFGKSAVVPRIFDKSEFKNGSIIDDFLSVVNIPANDNYILPPDSNERISPLGIDILRKLNEIFPRFVNGRPNPDRGNIVSYFEKHFSDQKYTAPAALIEQYEEVFSESNEWVRRHYFPQREVLFPKVTIQRDECTRLSESEITNIARLVADIWKKGE